MCVICFTSSIPSLIHFYLPCPMNVVVHVIGVQSEFCDIICNCFNCYIVHGVKHRHHHQPCFKKLGNVEQQGALIYESGVFFLCVFFTVHLQLKLDCVLVFFLNCKLAQIFKMLLPSPNFKKNFTVDNFSCFCFNPISI